MAAYWSTRIRYCPAHSTDNIQSNVVLDGTVLLSFVIGYSQFEVLADVVHKTVGLYVILPPIFKVMEGATDTYSVSSHDVFCPVASYILYWICNYRVSKSHLWPTQNRLIEILN